MKYKSESITKRNLYSLSTLFNANFYNNKLYRFFACNVKFEYKDRKAKVERRTHKNNSKQINIYAKRSLHLSNSSLRIRNKAFKFFYF